MHHLFSVAENVCAFLCNLDCVAQRFIGHIYMTERMNIPIIKITKQVCEQKREIVGAVLKLTQLEGGKR